MHSDTSSPSAAVRMTVDIRRFSWIRRLATDYALAYDRVAPFFAGNPAEHTAWADAIARTQSHRRATTEIARVIAAQQGRRSAPDASRAAAARLTDPRAVVIITGQQAGLFGGPFFTLLKALTAMKLAAQVSKEHGVLAIPVFWIDAEDHDWPEVQGCTVLDADLHPRTVRLADLPGAGHLPVARLDLTSDIEVAVDALAAALPDTDFKAALLDDLRTAYRPGLGMADAFGRWIESVLGPLGLVVYDSSDPAAKPLARDVFAREIAEPGTTAELAGAAGRALVARGYHAQVAPGAGAISLFHLNTGRESMRATGDRVSIGDRDISLAELAHEVQANPEHFSPNVLLRPVVQDTLFPTICYVAGPNELAYLGQLREVYTHFGVPMPLMYQRATATLLDSAAFRFLSKYRLPLESLRARDEAALNQLLEHQLPPTVEQALAAVASGLGERMDALALVIPQIDPTLEGTVRSTLGRMQTDLHTLHNKVIQA
ncbi:MAG: bacillithiol biosynthesis cysteine-adding enzyme BshC, partial [Acidobacteria bacterium]|nr:bacillithiol biosynthesis cysteine-adding enzyme BshC [Acidobacteriota bacterium]